MAQTLDAEETRRHRHATVDALMGIKPADELEGMLAAQLLACHNASMECYRRAMIGEQSFEGRRENLSQANKLSRTYASLLEALNRHRGKGHQKVTVEHVHVHQGAQAIVGNVTHQGGGGTTKSRINPMHPNRDPSPMNRAPRCRAISKRSRKPCRAPAVRGNVCRMHGAGGGAPEGNSNALKNGLYTAEAIKEQRAVVELIRRSREMIDIA